MNNNRLTVALLVLGFLFVGLVAIVANNDAGSRTEVALLNGTPVAHASDTQCDSLYYAVYKVKREPQHTDLINVAKALDCPFSE